MEGKTARGASSPANPALHIPDPLSTTNAATSSSHMMIDLSQRVREPKKTAKEKKKKNTSIITTMKGAQELIRTEWNAKKRVAGIEEGKRELASDGRSLFLFFFFLFGKTCPSSSQLFSDRFQMLTHVFQRLSEGFQSLLKIFF